MSVWRISVVAVWSSFLACDASDPSTTATRESPSAGASASVEAPAKDEAPVKGAAPNEPTSVAAATPAVDPPLSPPRRTIAAGSSHTCAVVRKDGEDRDRVKCWGQNDRGQLGLGDTKTRGAARRQMGDALPFVPLDESSPIVTVAAANARSCALQENGKLWCWGENELGQLGVGDVESRGDRRDRSPQAVELPGPVVTFSLGVQHGCATLADGSTHCWGLGLDGQLGVGRAVTLGDEPGELGDALPAIALGTDLRAHALAAGRGHTCALLDGGRIKCFGDGVYGQLGLADTRARGLAPEELGDALPFVDLGPDFRTLEITSGAEHVCARSSDHRVKCWGNGRVGQLGLGSTDGPGGKPGQSRVAPPTGEARPAVDLGSVGRVVAIAAGNSHTCVLMERGGPADVGLKCWGWDGAGELGLTPPSARGGGPGEMGDALPFVELGADLVPVALALGGAHTCVIVVERAEAMASKRPQTGRLECWGDGEHGATGMEGAERSSDDPKRMGDGLGFVNLGEGVRVVVPE